MNSVVGMVEVMEHSALSTEQTATLRAVRRASRAALSLVDDILDLARLESGRITLSRSEIDIGKVAENVRDIPVGEGGAQRVDWRLFVDPRVPDRLIGDGPRLQQLLSILVGVAIGPAAHRSDAAVVALRVTAEPTGDLCIRVINRSQGPDWPVLSDRFDPSDASSPHSSDVAADHMRLKIARRFAQLMGGALSLTSRSGSGSVLDFRMPMTAASAASPAAPAIDLKGIDCVLVASRELEVEDLQAYLQHGGARVAVVAAVADAVQRARLQPCGIVIRAGSSETDPQPAPGHSAQARQLLITRSRPTRRLGPDTMNLNAESLTRIALAKAVAELAGRGLPEVVSDTDFTALTDPAAQPPSVPEARARGELFLVAEDDPINRKVVVRQLSLLGYAAEFAGNGRDALRLWQEGGFCALITDLQMPFMDGYALARAVRAGSLPDRSKPIIALTADPIRGEEDLARAAGIDVYLTKPVSLARLREALATCRAR